MRRAASGELSESPIRPYLNLHVHLHLYLIITFIIVFVPDESQTSSSTSTPGRPPKDRLSGRMSPEDLKERKKEWSKEKYCEKQEAKKYAELSKKRTVAAHQKHALDKKAKMMKENKTKKNSRQNFQSILPDSNQWKLDILAFIAKTFPAISPADLR